MDRLRTPGETYPEVYQLAIRTSLIFDIARGENDLVNLRRRVLRNFSRAYRVRGIKDFRNFANQENLNIPIWDLLLYLFELRILPSGFFRIVESASSRNTLQIKSENCFAAKALVALPPREFLFRFKNGIGSAIRSYRTGMGWSLEDFREMLARTYPELKIPTIAIFSKFERGRGSISLILFLALICKLRSSPSQFFKRIEAEALRADNRKCKPIKFRWNRDLSLADQHGGIK